VRPDPGGQQAAVDEGVGHLVGPGRPDRPAVVRLRRLHVRDAAAAEGVPVRPPAAEVARDRQLDPLEEPPQPQAPQTVVGARALRGPGTTGRREERQLDQLGGQEPVLVDRDEDLLVARHQEHRRPTRQLLGPGSLWLVDDTTGRGHTTRVLSDWSGFGVDLADRASAPAV
jgi:hypothetical protein